MSFVFKRPFGAPNAVIYSYELSKYFLNKHAKSLLEVGCGIGIFAFRYAASQKKATIVGIDHSEKTVEFLSSNYGKFYKNLQFKSCDFCQEGLYLGSVFDEIYSSDVLEHVDDTKSFVVNLHRHLQAGGNAVVNFPNVTNHGINHFKDVNDVRRLFESFSDVKVYRVDIKHPVERLWFSVRTIYENRFSRETKKAREHLYSEREEQGIDSFEDSTCFQFITNHGKIRGMMASIVAETFLLIRPKIDIRQVQEGNILNSPRLVVVATK